MSDFFATLAGNDDEPSTDESVKEEAVVSTEAPAEPAVPAEIPAVEPEVTQEEDEPRAVLAMAKKKPASKKKASSDEPEGQLTVDVYQTKDDIVVKSTIAGVDADSLDVSITEDTITIRGARNEGETVTEENYYYRELYWGSFSRSIILPLEVDPDNAIASLKDGVLSIRVPKSSRSKERKVNVKKV